MEALYAGFESQHVCVDHDADPNAPDLIHLADQIVKALLKVGVVIPANLKSPYSSARKTPQPA
ncbi:hypothetical protein [Pseudarthrobacter sp. efr-133-R2A-89]|uniref:hypothetical protein n=1 Tax=Pseudarthrobacter sp. efr-133-R2A-89 TaxID=3040302 RepID=UPI00255594FF|nr:hypothetical protein [Pseudarthrobacter sp. efr-133-R2A-89]